MEPYIVISADSHAGLPTVAETRRMVGEAAAVVFGFDLDTLPPITEKIAVTPEILGRVDDAAAVARRENAKTVGRHWLTGHDFPLADPLAGPLAASPATVADAGLPA